MKQLIYLSVLGLFVACSTTKVNNQTQQLSPQFVELGAVGIKQKQLTTTTFETIAIPVLERKIRVQVTKIPFSNSTYKSYRKALSSQHATDTIFYADSLKVKPSFNTISLLDQISYVNELRNTTNVATVNYLKNIEQAGIVTTVSGAFNKQQQLLLSEAEEVYLVNNKLNKYELELYISNTLTSTIKFSESIIFGYQLSTICWGKTDNISIGIANLSSNSKCQRGTHKNPQKLIEKVNHFKF